MEIKINDNGKLEIHIGSLLECLRGEHLIDFLDRLACEDVIIRHVADQILEGFTEYRSCGPSGSGIEPRTALDLARRRVALGAGEVAAGEIGTLTRVAQEHEKRASGYLGQLIRLEDHIRDTGGSFPHAYVNRWQNDTIEKVKAALHAVLDESPMSPPGMHALRMQLREALVALGGKPPAFSDRLVAEESASVQS